MPADVLRRGLRHAVEHGVAAAGVGEHREVGPDAVLQFDLVPVARPAAVAVVLARAEERREDAVLHVKHRHVLMDDRLERGSRRCVS